MHANTALDFVIEVKSGLPQVCSLFGDVNLNTINKAAAGGMWRGLREARNVPLDLEEREDKAEKRKSCKFRDQQAVRMTFARVEVPTLFLSILFTGLLKFVV
ncbi:hypothetical protein E2C01_094142 [Portunus trituberculatus]|uniref:Uncharacterized protein n=1 Tax=Portunus trituberculatus TaxID=210409 RepID=A0A5B7JKY0_PORTR|nr:hypothetical protein [Portunus trituberculatus]